MVLKLSVNALVDSVYKAVCQTNQEAYFKSLDEIGFYFAFALVILAALKLNYTW